MPLDIVGQLTAGFFIVQIKALLEKKNAKYGIQFLGGPTHYIAEKREYASDGQFWKDNGFEQSRPCGVEKLSPFGAEKPPGIEKFGLFVIVDVNHAFSL